MISKVFFKVEGTVLVSGYTAGYLSFSFTHTGTSVYFLRIGGKWSMTSKFLKGT